MIRIAVIALLVTLTATNLHPAMAETQAPSFGARLENYRYPFQVQFFKLKSQNRNLEMAYMHLPAKAGHPTALLMHGKNFNSAYWVDVAKHLQHHGWGVLMPDQIGFGKSSKPTAYQYSFNQLAKHTHQLVTALGLTKVVVLGHSMGGMLAARFALTFPDTTSRLVLLNPIGLEDYLDYTEYPTIDKTYQRQRTLKPANIIAYQKKNYYAGQWTERYDALTMPLRGWLLGPDRDRLALVSALTYDMILTQPVIDDLKNLNVPTTLIIGTRDRTGPNRSNKRKGVTYELGRYDRLGRRARDLIPNTKLIELKGIGHLPHIENFDRFTTALAEALDLPTQ